MALQLTGNPSLTTKLVSAFVTVIVLLLAGAAHPTKAATIVVPIGGNLQAAANAAQCGDTIIVQAGARFVTPGLEVPALILKSKPCSDTSWITIQSENSASLPATFKTQTPLQLRALNLPKLVSDTATPALEAEAGSHHYRIVGFEITNDSLNRTRVNNGLIFAGIRHGSSPSLTLATVPNQIEFDRVWVHGEEDGTDSEIATCLRGFMLGARNITVKNSRIAGFRAFAPGQPDYGQSSQAILIEKGPGPYTIHNSYLEAWFTSIFTGGGPQWITNQATVSNASMSQATLSNVANLNVGDYVAFRVTGQGSKYQVAKVTGISGNVVTYVPQSGLPNGDNPSEVTGNPLRTTPEMPGDAVWNGDTPRNIRITNNIFYKNPVVGATVALSGLYGKGHIEFKTVNDGLVEGNDFSGYAAGFTITSRNQSDESTSGNNPWATITNLTFRNNVWRGIPRPGRGALIGIQLNDNMNTTVQGRNVVFENMLFENLWSPLLHIGGSADVTFRNVTAVGGTPLGEDSMILAHSGANEGFRLENNILQNNEYGVNCPLGSTAACYPNYVVNGNVILDNRTPEKKIAAGPLSNIYPWGNYYPETIGQIQFVNTLSSQWGLAATSPYKGLGNNGMDPGVDMARLLSALGGILPPPPPPPSPTPTPVPTPTPTPVPTPTPTPVPTPTPTPVPTPTPTPVPTPTPTPTPIPTPIPTPSPSPTPTPSPTPPPPAPSAYASFVVLDTTTKGNWKNTYGSQGYNTINDAMSYPSYAQISVSGYTSPYWDDSTTDVRALQKAVGTDRVAARWSANSSFTIDLNMTDGQSHRVALYSLDWDGNNRTQRIDVVDWATGASLDSRSISSFNGGQYLVWDIRGRVRLVVTRTGAKTAVLSGLYFGAAGSTPTPTPTPVPTPSPSPTPTPSPGSNNAPYVSVISPAVNSVFGTGSNVTILSSAGDSDGTISRVDFYRSGSLIGTATSSPYNCVWANVPSGNYSLTAVATDNLGARATSSPVAVSVKNSPASVNKARGRGNNLLTSLGSNPSYGGGEESYTAAALTADLMLLVTDVQTAYTDFIAEQSTFGSSAAWINTQLSAALYLSKSDAALAAKVGSSSSVRNHLLRLVAHLAVSEDLMLYGSVTAATQTQAATANARLDLVIGPAHPSYTLNGSAEFAPLSLGSAFADAVSAPLASQSLFASIAADGSAPYELAGINVTVGGHAVPVLYVSPSRISFHVSGDVPLGLVDVIVTSQNGFVSRGVTNITPNLLEFMTRTDDRYGSALAINGNKQTPESFDLITTENFGLDKRTRVTIFAAGISGSANNWDPSNDVVVGGVVRKNFAESVTVIARLNNGELITLPVEFAGMQGNLPGIDQVNFVLTSALAAAGPIEMTIFVNGQRSNAPKIVVR